MTISFLNESGSWPIYGHFSASAFARNDVSLQPASIVDIHDDYFLSEIMCTASKRSWSMVMLPM